MPKHKKLLTLKTGGQKMKLNELLASELVNSSTTKNATKADKLKVYKGGTLRNQSMHERDNLQAGKNINEFKLFQQFQHSIDPVDAKKKMGTSVFTSCMFQGESLDNMNTTSRFENSRYLINTAKNLASTEGTTTKRSTTRNQVLGEISFDFKSGIPQSNRYSKHNENMRLSDNFNVQKVIPSVDLTDLNILSRSNEHHLNVSDSTARRLLKFDSKDNESLGDKHFDVQLEYSEGQMESQRRSSMQKEEF